MQLHYLWIKDYKNIKEQGFNFSAKYIFDYNPELAELKIVNNPEFIEHFFGSLFSNITGVIGENGTGKSNLFDLDEITFFVAETRNKFYLISEKSEKIKIIQSPFKIIQEKKHKFDDTIVVRYSNHFDGFIRNRFTDNFNLFDKTTDNVLAKNYFVNPHEENNLLEKYKNYETFTQTEFLISLSKIKLPFKTPESLKISFSLKDEYKFIVDEIKILEGFQNKNYIEDELKILIQLRKMFIDELYNFHQKRLQLSNTSFLQEMTLLQLEWTIIFNFINTYPANTEGSCLVLFRDNDIDWKNKPIDSWIYSYYKKIELEYAKPDFYHGLKYWGQYIHWSNNVEKFLLEIKKLMVESNDVDIIYLDRNKFFFDVTTWPASETAKIPSEAELIFNLSSKQSFKQFEKSFYKNYKNIIWSGRIDSMGFLSFEWRNISTGEKSLLSLFTRLNSINFNIDAINRNDSTIRHNSEKVENLIFLLDEAEFGMHPNWQKALLNIIFKSFPILFKNIKAIQLIIATHSPFIVSNLPVSNLIFLKKDDDNNCQVVKNPLQDQKQTFASNIHTLFTDSFFMEGNLMGDFAKDKINEIIDDLLSQKELSEERKAYIKKIISIVGEPIIKRKLLQLYEDKFNLKLETELIDLKKRIDFIERKLNDSNKKKKR